MTFYVLSFSSLLRDEEGSRDPNFADTLTHYTLCYCWWCFVNQHQLEETHVCGGNKLLDNHFGSRSLEWHAIERSELLTKWTTLTFRKKFESTLKIDIMNGYGIASVFEIAFNQLNKWCTWIVYSKYPNIWDPSFEIVINLKIPRSSVNKPGFQVQDSSMLFQNEIND